MAMEFSAEAFAAEAAAEPPPMAMELTPPADAYDPAAIA